MGAGEIADFLNAPAAVAQFGNQRGDGIEMVQPVGDRIICDIAVLHRREEDNRVCCRIWHQELSNKKNGHAPQDEAHDRNPTKRIRIQSSC
jgi:hypothetical protein